MAQVGTKVVNKTFNKFNRAWRTTVETPFVAGGVLADYLSRIRMIGHRELILVDPDDGSKFREEAKYVVARGYDEIKDELAPIVNDSGVLAALPAAAAPGELGVYDNGDGTFSVTLNMALLFAAAAAFGDTYGIAAPENPDNVEQQ